MDNVAQVRYGFAVFLLTLFALSSCTPPPPRDTHDADVRTITEGEALWARDWRFRDADRIISHYSEDATLMLPNLAPATGRESIREVVREIVKDGNLMYSFDATRVDVAKSGDIGYAQGTYTLTMTDLTTKKAARDRGSYLRVYRKQMDGTWKVLHDMRASQLASPALTE